jgi:hypothetical protein
MASTIYLILRSAPEPYLFVTARQPMSRRQNPSGHSILSTAA